MPPEPTLTLAAAASSPEKERMRVERLAGLGRLWGTVKYFHPFLAYKDIDWDGALVRAVPRVRDADTPEAFLTAINAMLDEVGDPATHAAIAPTQTDSSADSSTDNNAWPANGDGAAWRVVNGVAILDCRHGAQLTADRALPSAEELADIRGVVVDCRGTSRNAAVVAYLQTLVEVLADRPVTSGTYRYREHVGYADPIDFNRGRYRSSLVTDAPVVWRGRRKSPAPPLAFVIDSAASDLRDVLSGLQAAHLATIVRQTGTAAAPESEDFPTVDLPGGIVATVRTTEFVGASGEADLRPDVEISAPATPAADQALDAALKSLFSPRPASHPVASQSFVNLQGHSENPYPEMHFPNTEYRLLSLFRLWNVMHYFFPYKELMDRPWAEALIEFIPKFEDSRDAFEYQRTVMELAARLQDSHVGVYAADAVEERWGRFAPPIIVTSIEGRTVITALPDAHAAKASGLQVGDIVVAIDGEPVEQLRARTEPFISASTPHGLCSRVDARLLRGPKDSVARLRVEGDGGAMRDVDVARTELRTSTVFARRRTTPATYEVLPPGYGYIDLARLRYEDADTALDAVMETPALIFDLRGYPNGTAWPITPRLAAEGKATTGAQIRSRIWTGCNIEDTDGRLSYDQTFAPSGKRHYHGKVVVLINEQAISQSEHTCLFFAAATDVTFIGSPTVGANGNVTETVLPGRLAVSFTGMEIRWADGRQLQRVGVKPHIHVAPTVKGIREGRDEVLEAALTFLQQTLKR